MTEDGIVSLGRQAEEAGYDCLMVPEGIEGNDALLCCYMLAVATKRVRVATNVANIYLRDPSLCAVSAATIQQASHGRFILGVGPSHRPVLQAMGIEMGNARDHLRKYTLELRKAFSGERAKNLGVHFPHPDKPVPIYFGALTLETPRMGGELADGLLLVHCTAQRLSQMIRAAHESARQFGRRPDVVTVCISVQAYFHDDMKVARQAARGRNGALHGAALLQPAVAQQRFCGRGAGRSRGVAKGRQRRAGRRASDRLIDAVTLCGPASHCRERMAALSECGVDMIAIMPGAVGGEDPLFSVKRRLAALAPR